MLITPTTKFTRTYTSHHTHPSLDVKKTSVLKDVPSFKEFLTASISDSQSDAIAEAIVPAKEYLASSLLQGNLRKVFFETYGCQMNVSDTEVVWAILKNTGYERTEDINSANVIFIMTCAIREGAEHKVWGRLDFFRSIKRKRKKNNDPSTLKVAVLGCMAERLKTKLLVSGKAIDLVVGPDAYRDLPRLLSVVEGGQQAANVQLSLEETYADITPVRMTSNSVSAFVSIMRGCDNMCSYCIVPFTRGRERSRPMDSIIAEVRNLSESGVKEVTLLGQNVNSYRDLNHESAFFSQETTKTSDGFKSIYKSKKGGARFADLLDKVSLIDPNMRIRFTSPHPKDFPEELLELIGDRANVQYEQAFLFAYSMREKTHAHRRFEDDVDEDVKQRRLREIIDVFRNGAEAANEKLVGTRQLVLVDSIGRKSGQFAGRTDGFTRVVLSGGKVTCDLTGTAEADIKLGDFVSVDITGSNSQTLRGNPVAITDICTFSSLRSTDERKIAASASC
eukprot:CFRG7072T1